MLLGADDIDQALLRIDEGSYGVCARCGKDIPERRLDALPTARYDAECQSLIEQNTGEDEHATKRAADATSAAFRITSPAYRLAQLSQPTRFDD